MRPTRFRGRKIYEKKYPCVYWPKHPMSWNDGVVPIHRVVAYEKYGNLDGMNVHHLDEDIWNWSPENLLLMKHEVHKQLHAGTFPEQRQCAQCGDAIVVRSAKRQKRDKIYCSLTCSNTARHAVQWPNVALVKSMVDLVGYSATGRDIGVSDNAVRSFLHRELA